MMWRKLFETAGRPNPRPVEKRGYYPRPENPQRSPIPPAGPVRGAGQTRQSDDRGGSSQEDGAGE